MCVENVWTMVISRGFHVCPEGAQPQAGGKVPGGCMLLESLHLILCPMNEAGTSWLDAPTTGGVDLAGFLQMLECCLHMLFVVLC